MIVLPYWIFQLFSNHVFNFTIIETITFSIFIIKTTQFFL